MTVFAVCVPYEGPEYLFSTQEKADAALVILNDSGLFIVEYQLDPEVSPHFPHAPEPERQQPTTIIGLTEPPTKGKP